MRMTLGSFGNRVPRFVPVAAVLFIALMCSVPQLIGQGITTGSITGTVEDPQQSVINGARITAVNNGTNAVYNAVTNSVGYFEMRGVPVGTYTVTIEAPVGADNSGRPLCACRRALVSASLRWKAPLWK